MLARSLAPSLRSLDDVVEAQPRGEWLVFRVSEEQYAIPLGAVAEIMMPGPLHLIPRVPIEVGGMLNARGEPLAAVDGGLALGTERGTGRRHLLVLTADDTQIGILVEAVLRIDRDLDLAPPSRAVAARGDRDGTSRGGAARPPRDLGCVEWKRRRDDTQVGVVDAAALVRCATDLLCEHRVGNKEEPCHDAF